MNFQINHRHWTSLRYKLLHDICVQRRNQLKVCSKGDRKRGAAKRGELADSAHWTPLTLTLEYLQLYSDNNKYLARCATPWHGSLIQTTHKYFRVGARKTWDFINVVKYYTRSALIKLYSPSLNNGRGEAASTRFGTLRPGAERGTV